MRYLFNVGLSIFFGFLAVGSLLALVVMSVITPICLLDVFVHTGVKVGLGQAVVADIVLVILFSVSSQLFRYFSKEKYQ